MDIKNNLWFIVSVLFIRFSVKSHVCYGADTISANSSLSGDQTIVSGGGVFELGFFNPGNSSNYYIGIWYKKLPEKTIVWVANRDKPISNRYSSMLRISNGNLVLFNESGIPIWSTNLDSVVTSSTELEAVLLDEGNLVLREFSTNSSMPSWQSFDNPAHTWLPGMKFGRNKRTKVNQPLTSWKNREDPAPGFFTLEADENVLDQYVLSWNRSEQYWKSGKWNGEILPTVPEMGTHHIFEFSYVSNENESYLIYCLTVPLISRFIMDASGQIKDLVWIEASKNWLQFWTIPKEPCDVYAYCGAFSNCNQQTQLFCVCLPGFKPNLEHDWNLLEDHSGGCVRKTQLQCQNSSLVNGKSDKFLEILNVVLPSQPQSAPARSIAECETTCLSNCSCTAYAYEKKVCSIWIGDLLNLKQLAQGDTNGETIYIKLAASEFSSPGNSKRTVIIGVVGTAAFMVFLGLVVFVYLRKRAIKTIKAMEGGLMAFSHKDLRYATKNFSEKLGGGGFGSVFKRVLPNSSLIAVKRLESIGQGEKQFRAEVSTIGNIQHVNLVRLLGFCSEGTRKLLVYDYMPNGSLNFHLFPETDSKALHWETRYRIALGTARGLAYLHEKCRDCIIHCDVKPENILLDSEFCPKVTDFGLAKLVGREFSRVLTTMRGTRGYLAPEWISGVAITVKADVFSYGMMLFEIVSGRRNSEQSENGKVKFFPTWAVSLVAEGANVLGLLDPRLEGKADIEELSRIFKVAGWCIQDDETHRPSMGQVVQILEGILEVTQSPIPKSFQLFADGQEQIIFFNDSSSNQSSLLMGNSSAVSSQVKSTTSSTSS